MRDKKTILIDYLIEALDCPPYDLLSFLAKKSRESVGSCVLETLMDFSLLNVKDEDLLEKLRESKGSEEIVYSTKGNKQILQLKGANLNQANFSNSKFSLLDFSQINWGYADLKEVHFETVQLSSQTLLNVKNLETIKFDKDDFKAKEAKYAALKERELQKLREEYEKLQTDIESKKFKLLENKSYSLVLITTSFKVL